METNPTTPLASPEPITKKSSFSVGSVSFLVGVLLFLLPFAEIKCGDTTVKEVRGIEFATGFKVESTNKQNSLFGNLNFGETQKSSKSEKRDPNMFALAALGLGILGFVFSYTAKGNRSVMAALMGALAFISLIILMINIKADSKLENTASSNNNDVFGSSFGNNIIRVEFTVWYYITLILFLVAAYVCWQKKKSPVANVSPAAIVNESKPAE